MIKTREDATVGDTGPVQKIYRFSELPAVTGLKDAKLQMMIKDGTFPAPLRLTSKATGWLESDIATWQAGLAAAREGRNE